MVDHPHRLGDAREDRVASRSACSASRWAVMSTNVVTTPRPVGRSIGTDVYETGNISPSRRKNQSSSMRTRRPERRASRTGQSSAGYGLPSGCA
jgi:hypothetical protein